MDNPFMDQSLLDLITPLAALQNISVHGDDAAVLQHLHTMLSNYMELEYRHDGKRIDLISLTRDPAEVSLFLEVLAARGFSDKELAVLRDLTEFGEGKVNGMKLPLAGQQRSGELYLRGSIDLNEAYYFLGKYGISESVLEQVGQVAQVFDKTHLHMLAVDAGLPLQFTLFLTTYLATNDRTADWQQVSAACAAVGLPADVIRSYLLLHRLLSAARPATLFFSFGIVDGRLVPRIKIDYVDVRLGSLKELLKGAGLTTQLPVLTAWGKALRRDFANYAGVILDPSGISGVRAYFNMSYG